MSRNENPCYGCRERAEACHTQCERYRLWRRAKDAECEERAKERTTRWDVNAVKDKYICKLRKRTGAKVGKQL